MECFLDEHDHERREACERGCECGPPPVVAGVIYSSITRITTALSSGPSLLHSNTIRSVCISRSWCLGPDVLGSVFTELSRSFVLLTGGAAPLAPAWLGGPGPSLHVIAVSLSVSATKIKQLCLKRASDSCSAPSHRGTSAQQQQAGRSKKRPGPAELHRSAVTQPTCRLV